LPPRQNVCSAPGSCRSVARRLGFSAAQESNSRIRALPFLGGGDHYLGEAPDGGRDPLELIAQSVLIASYLPAFYLIFGPNMPEHEAGRAVRTLEVLKAASSIGVLLLRDPGRASVLARPRAAPARN
jgi:hypothetical protein